MARNTGFEYRERLGAEADGRRLLDHLVRSYRHSSIRQWRERIESGAVLLDLEPARPDSLVRRGQTLVWRRPPWDEPRVPETLDVVFEDEDLLALAKPAGLPTLPGGGFLQSTVLHHVRAHAPQARPVHRLGRWTSGVVLCAKTRSARADLARQWAERRVRKLYRALAGGEARSDEFVVTAPIGPVPHAAIGSVHAASDVGKPATSRILVLEQRDGGFLCEVAIETGRPHQIRIHLAAAGYPLVGDPLYDVGGVPPPRCRALPGDSGYHLHAMRLTFRHPRTRRDVRIECSPPPLLARADQRL